MGTEVGQKPLVYDWADRDVILREMKLPRLKTRHNSSVSTTTAQLVLYKINSRAGKRGTAWPTIERLRQDCNGLHERTIRRAIEALEAAGFLAVERKKKIWAGGREVGNRYVIVWSELALTCNPATRKRLTTGHSVPPRPDILCSDDRTYVSDKARASEATIEARGRNELTFPDFSDLNLGSHWDVGHAIDRLESAGMRFDHGVVALAAAIAVRRGKRASGLFVSLLRDGFGKYQPSDLDHEAARRTLRVLQGLSDGDSDQRAPRERQAEQAV